jgi:hypothetical protein
MREQFEAWYFGRFTREPMPDGYESGIAWNAWQARAAPALPQPEHDLQDIQCQCCGYMTYHREHMGCIRSAYKQALPQGVEEWMKQKKFSALSAGEFNDVVSIRDLRALLDGMAIAPVEPTEAMLVAARDWSYKKYGKPIGNDAAQGCWQAMLAAAEEKGDA